MCLFSFCWMIVIDAAIEISTVKKERNPLIASMIMVDCWCSTPHGNDSNSLIVELRVCVARRVWNETAGKTDWVGMVVNGVIWWLLVESLSRWQNESNSCGRVHNSNAKKTQWFNRRHLAALVYSQRKEPPRCSVDDDHVWWWCSSLCSGGFS